MKCPQSQPHSILKETQGIEPGPNMACAPLSGLPSSVVGVKYLYNSPLPSPEGNCSLVHVCASQALFPIKQWNPGGWGGGRYT